MIHYVAKLLQAGSMQAQDIQEVQQWTHSDWKESLQDYNKEGGTLFTLYIPKLQTRSRIPHIPPRRRATDKQHGTKHIFACHATEEGNLINLLQSGRFRSSTLHDPQAIGFYAHGTETTGTAEHDRWNTSRVLAKTSDLDNKAIVFLHLMAFGTGFKFLSGGEPEGDRLLRLGPGAMKHDRGKRFIIHPDNAIIRGVAWQCSATPPQTFL